MAPPAKRSFNRSRCFIPSGAMESASANESAIECLHVYLPPTLMEQSALENYDVDPAKTVLSFVRRRER